MDWKFIIPFFVFAAPAVALFVYFAKRRDDKKDAAKKRVSDFRDFESRFRRKILDAQRPDDWIPDFKRDLDELRNRFRSVWTILPKDESRNLAEQLDAMIPFTELMHGDLYQREDELKAIVAKLGQRN